MTNVDLVIVGGGFAGLAAAKAAAVRGVRVVVLEKKAAAGEKMHTTGILVKEVADTWDVPAAICHKVEGVRLYSPNMKFVDLYSPDYFFLSTDIKALMEYFTEEALRAGAEVRFDSPFYSAHKSGDRLIIDGYDLKTRFLIGADGAKSSVAKTFSLSQNQEVLIGMELEYPPLPDFSQNHLHCFINSEIAPGYIAWVVPGKKITQIGLAARPPKKKRLEDLLEKLQKHFPSIQKTKPLGKRAGLIPVGGLIKPFYTDRVMLIGDSAGMVSPLTAGGIQMALDYGRLAGVSVTNFLFNNAIHPGKQLSRALPNTFFKKILRKIADQKISNQLFNFFLNWSIFRKFAKIIYFHHLGLKSKRAWKELIGL